MDAKEPNPFNSCLIKQELSEDTIGSIKIEPPELNENEKSTPFESCFIKQEVFDEQIDAKGIKIETPDNTIISQNETKAPKQPWNIILSTNKSSKVCCQKMFDLKCKWLQWSGCS